jgi:hypothetical protein
LALRLHRELPLRWRLLRLLRLLLLLGWPEGECGLCRSVRKPGRIHLELLRVLGPNQGQ